jgi:hypothetical protein
MARRRSAGKSALPTQAAKRASAGVSGLKTVERRQPRLPGGGLVFVLVLFFTRAMPVSDGLRFVIKMALRNALKLVRGLRKQISDIDEDVMTAKLINEINLSNYEIVKKAGTCGHVVDLPAETKTTREP